MNPWLGWILAVVLGAVSWQAYRWPGVAMAASAIVFWLLLQFNRALRVMKAAAGRPLGEVPSAVMFNARLQPKLTMLQIVTRTKTLGRKVEGTDDDWTWHDAGGNVVRLHLERGRLVRWQLERPDASGAAAAADIAGPPPTAAGEGAAPQA
jgi:hypothetical protein